MTRHTTQAGPGSEFFTRTRFIQPPVAKGSLVAWYPFREGTGADITAGDSDFGDSTDYSATVNGATFQPSGGVTDVKTRANSGAFAFDGVDDNLTHNLSNTLVFGDTVTAMIWVKYRGSFNSGVETMIDVRFGSLNDPNQRAVGLGFNSRGDFFVQVDDSNTGVFAGTSVGGSFASNFHHYALRYDDPDLTLFVDGQPVTTDTGSTTSLQSSKGIVIGSDFGGGRENDMVSDGVRLYNSALSDSQMNQIYLNTKP
jgi:hypothetical protein